MATLEYSLFDDFSLKGTWWLPDSPDHQVGGFLNFRHQEQIELDLIGSFADITTIGRGSLTQPKIILGVTDNGIPCTLFRNSETSKNISSSGSNKSTFQSRYLFAGKHYLSPAELVFTGLHISVTDLEIWIGENPFGIAFPKEKNANPVFSIHYHHPAVFNARVPVLDSTVRSSSTFGTKGGDFSETCIKHQAFLVVEPDTPQPFLRCWRIIHDLAGLLTLLVGDIVYPRHVMGQGDEYPVRDGVTQRESIAIYYPMRKPETPPKRQFFDVLVPLRVIRSNIPAVLQMWFEKAESLRSVFDLFFGSLYNPHMYLQFHFLALTQAIESYHRVAVGGKYLSDADWEIHRAALTTCIPSSLDSGHKLSLKSRIQYGNEYSLRKRISQLLAQFSQGTRGALFLERSQFPDSIVDTRNYLTHYDERLRDKALDGTALYYANQQLKMLLMLLLLRDIGIAEDVVTRAFQGNRDYKHILNQVQAMRSGGTSSDSEAF